MILLGFFVSIVFIQIFYYLFIFGKFSFLKNERSKSDVDIPKEGVSIIVCAKNEEETLSRNIDLIINQNFENFELILVNDGSTDNTLSLMKLAKEKYNTIVDILILSIPQSESVGGKKRALSKGISKAKFKKLLLTDADCWPNSSKWISLINSKLSGEKKIVLGYGAYKKINKSLLNKLIRFETLITAIQYFSYAKIGIAYMGVGRNLAYHKDLFVKFNGFSSHDKVLSGDDDLFINEVSTNDNVSICFDQDSFTISEPKKSYKSWFNQKRRHVSTSSHYKTIHKVLLGLFYLSQVMFWILSGYFLFFTDYRVITLWLFIARMLFWYLTIIKSSIKLKETDLILLAPILELFLIIFQLCIFISNKLFPHKKWLS